ncbi:hypothetical protein ACT6QH_04790 [Xanthobacter sp. TB0139]|uniref:hypothetical protein n=1 Tax=Xanthobacter sp. TB0139 TaxID=3459178 RepID=UPI004039134F
MEPQPFYVRIAKCETAQIPQNSEEFQINGAGVTFFSDAITHSSLFRHDLESDDIFATFFEGTPFESSWRATFYEPAKGETARINPPQSSKGVFIRTSGHADFDIEKQMLRVAQFTRGSNTLPRASVRETAPNSIFISDNGAFGYISGNADQFLRIFATQMLAMAYLDAISSTLHALRQAVIQHRTDDNGTHDAIRLVHERGLLFNAGFHQRNPIKAENPELQHVWESLSQHLHLEAQHSELSAHLSALTEWLRADEMRKDDAGREEQIRREKKMQAEQQALDARREAEQKRNTYVSFGFLGLISILLIALVLAR